jgi:hypothetical protein
MNWQYTIDLAGVLDKACEEFDLSLVENDCPKAVKENIANELKKAFPLARFAPRIMKAKSIAAVNRILNTVYDEADRSKVWCGL